ncbi:hypothetical protein AVEN_258755-1 [Araneus ventricosus]|uniref:Uncharacterized protein n=1 Tax=Araneus ventricosus TaxID=182803 RepID=A0A4Y2D073_ARAVE|nr:hypothetical protein AVEN_258755-1 [Araneus ventricosus]
MNRNNREKEFTFNLPRHDFSWKVVGEEFSGGGFSSISGKPLLCNGLPSLIYNPGVKELPWQPGIPVSLLRRKDVMFCQSLLLATYLRSPSVYKMSACY